MSSQELSKKRIVVIGGGTGIFPVLTGLNNSGAHISAIVTMSDDGGSTGILREEFGILPPGDIRRALVALSSSDHLLLSQLLNYRFKEGRGLEGHAFGNLLLTALHRVTGNFETAVDEAKKMLGVQGDVIPVTLQSTHLMARLENGNIIRGETNVDIPKHDGRLRIESVWLSPRAKLNPRAARAIKKADMIVLGPGDPYTSIIPNLIVDGMQEALEKSKAKIIYCVNLLTKFGETTGFAASDFVRTMQHYVGKRTIDYAIINSTRPSLQRIKPYFKERADFVKTDTENIASPPTPILADLMRTKGFIRHDAKKVAKIILSLI